MPELAKGLHAGKRLAQNANVSNTFERNVVIVVTVSRESNVNFADVNCRRTPPVRKIPPICLSDLRDHGLRSRSRGPVLQDPCHGTH